MGDKISILDIVDICDQHQSIKPNNISHNSSHFTAEVLSLAQGQPRAGVLGWAGLGWAGRAGNTAPGVRSCEGSSEQTWHPPPICAAPLEHARHASDVRQCL